MKEYPSIEHYSNIFSGRTCYAFYKLDGSNLRWEWSKKRGWFKFGTRTRLFDKTDEVFGEAVNIFEKQYAEQLSKKFTDYYKIQNAIVFTEFLGENSFAGTHVKEDPKKLVLFDVNLYKKGIMSPKEFIKEFSTIEGIETPQLIYNGVLNYEIYTKIKNNNIGINLIEGVVCKGGEGHKLWMCKIKTHSYIEKLKEVFNLEWKKYE